MMNAAERRPDETHLPGGTIGRPRTFNDRTTSWTRTAESGVEHVPDCKLERTSLRWADGWYLVTSAPGASTATWRRGPFVECANAEDALLNLAGSISDGPSDTQANPTPDTAPGPDGRNPNSIEDLDFLDHVDLPNSTYERVAQICNEGQAKRLYDACGRWLREVERQKSASGGPDSPPTAPHCEDMGLGASGVNSPAEARRAHDDMPAAARAYDVWLQG